MRMLSTFTDLLFPPRETEVIVRNLLSNKGIFYRGTIEVGQTLYLLPYRDERVRALISENKYHHNTRAATLLSECLDEWVTEQSTSIVFIPIPLSKKRQKERGYNQVTEIVRRLKSKNIQVLDSVLIRNKHTARQTELHKTERQKNIRDAFTCSQPEKLRDMSGTVFVLVDDVVTTGSTINEARATLAPHLNPTATLITLTLAH